MTVLTTNRDRAGDVTTWNLLWEAAMAVFWKCLSRGMKGTHRGLGEGFLTLDENTQEHFVKLR